MARPHLGAEGYFWGKLPDNSAELATDSGQNKFIKHRKQKHPAATRWVKLQHPCQEHVSRWSTWARCEFACSIMKDRLKQEVQGLPEHPSLNVARPSGFQDAKRQNCTMLGQRSVPAIESACFTGLDAS